MLQLAQATDLSSVGEASCGLKAEVKVVSFGLPESKLDGMKNCTEKGDATLLLLPVFLLLSL